MWLFFPPFAPDKWLVRSFKLACLLLAVALPCLFAYQALGPCSVPLFGLTLCDCWTHVKKLPPLCSAQTQSFLFDFIYLSAYYLNTVGPITLFKYWNGWDFIIKRHMFASKPASPAYFSPARFCLAAGVLDSSEQLKQQLSPHKVGNECACSASTCRAALELFGSCVQ